MFPLEMPRFEILYLIILNVISIESNFKTNIGTPPQLWQQAVHAWVLISNTTVHRTHNLTLLHVILTRHLISHHSGTDSQRQFPVTA